MKILIQALSGIGDALMFSPALKHLRKNLPDARIDMLCMFKGVEDIFRLNPDLNNVIHFDFIKHGAVNSLRFVLSLRGKYDATINVYPSNRREYNIISFLIGAKNRLAVRYLRKDFVNAGFLNNKRITENDNYHNVTENLIMVNKLIGKSEIPDLPMSINFDTASDDYSGNYLDGLGINESDIVIGFHAGCAVMKNHIKRRWAPENFASLGNKIISDLGAKILLFGGPDEYALNEQINNLMDNKAIQVKTDSLLHTAAVMRRCNCFVTNDSALLHVASALGLKTVAIFGPTNTNYVHPWMNEHKIVKLNLECQPCFFYSPKPLTCTRSDVQFKCIKEITPEMVLTSVKEFFTN